MKRIVLSSLTALALLAGGFLPGGLHVAQASTAIVVTPADMSGWNFSFSGTSSGAMVAGPESTPLGTGSALLAVGADGNGAAQLRNSAYAGTKLSDITALSYSTYVSNFNGCQAPYIILNVDNDANGTTDDLLFFEPCYQTGAYGGDPIPNQGTPVLNTWQTWNALGGGWWALSADTFGPPLVTLGTYTAANPNATVVNPSSLGGVRIVAGFGAGVWDNFDGNVDAFTVGVSGNSITYDFEPVTLGNCFITLDVPNKLMSLTSDCITDHTLYVPDGWTLNGNSYSITAVDPVGDHFRGAVIKNGGGEAHVTDLTVTTTVLANVCDAGDDRLRGILFDGAGGSITNNTVVNINQGASGCQEGNGIEVRNAPFDSTGADLTVLISGNTVTNYQKNGITANGSVAATITNNVVTGAGPVNYIAQNGIQVGFGGTAIVTSNMVSGNDYTPKDTVACGLLYFQADGVNASANSRFNNERDQCNFGKGGGTYKPAP
jgi:hypothetical protein